MPRPPRLVVPGFPHHVTQRGNYKQRVFFSDADRGYYLELLGEYSRHYGVSLEAYCLMENHVHLVLVPHTQSAMARMMQRLDSEYTRRIHVQRDTMGHLWQARYHSVVLDQEHFWAAMVYVERNPCRAGLVEHPWQWPWSSAAAHVDEASSALLSLVRWRSEHTPESWKRHLELGVRGAALADRIRTATLNGWPLGNDEFLTCLESRLDRAIKPRAAGRPRKKGPASHSPTNSAMLTAS